MDAMVFKKEDHTLSNADTATAMAALIEPLSDDEIEKLTIEAIRDYRSALDQAECAHDAWLASREKAAPATIHALHGEYVKQMLAHSAKQFLVATLIERLGYVPVVPVD
ncbi:transcriptional repressor TraM (plasmid) [Nitrobacteraceae bacterium UC4446_H13]